VVLVTEGDLCWSDLEFFAQIFHYFVLIVNTLACLCNLFIEVLCFDNQASLVRLQFKAVQVLIRREEPRVKWNNLANFVAFWGGAESSDSTERVTHHDALISNAKVTPISTKLGKSVLSVDFVD